MDMLNAASGGIVAFANEGEVELNPEESARLQQQFLERQQYENFARKQREAAGVGAPKASLADLYAKQQADLAEDRKRKGGYDLINYSLELGTQPGGLLQAGLQAGKRVLPGMIAREDALRGREGDIAKGMAEVAEGERLMKLGDITAGNAMFEKGQERLNKIEVAQSRKPTDMVAYAETYLAEKVASGDTRDRNVIFREGMDIKKRLDAEAQNARTGVAAQSVAQTGQNLTRDDANKEIATVNTPGYKDYKARMKARKAEADWNKLTPAEKKAEDARISGEVRDKILSRNQSGGGSSKPKASGNKANPAQFDADNS
jgi:hypothetical protein